MSKTIQFQMEIEERQLNELERLKEEGGCRTMKELMNNACSLLKWAAKVSRDGKEIWSVDEKGGHVSELAMPFLENVAARARASSGKSK